MDERIVDHLYQKLVEHNRELTQRVAELTEENQKLKSGELKVERINGQIDSLLDSAQSLHGRDKGRVIRGFSTIPADSLREHKGFMTWYGDWRARVEELGVVVEKLKKLSEDELGSMSRLVRELELA